MVRYYTTVQFVVTTFYKFEVFIKAYFGEIWDSNEKMF